jgi:hypothetical protein
MYDGITQDCPFHNFEATYGITLEEALKGTLNEEAAKAAKKALAERKVLCEPPKPKSEAVFWDCRDSERLEHDCPEDAILDLLDVNYDKEIPPLDQIRNLCPLEVKGYAREEIEPKFIRGLAERATENFIESIEEEFGDPEGDHPLLSPEEQKSLIIGLQLGFAQALSKAKVWRCKVVETKTFTAEEVETMVRESNPGWFED